MIKNVFIRLYLVLFIFFIAMVSMIAVVDMMGSTGKIYSARVLERTFIKPTSLPVIDTCLENPSAECSYQPGESTTRYGLAVDLMGDIEVYPVPKSYFYSVKENHHIPVRKKKGFLTGIVYANNVKFETK